MKLLVLAICFLVFIISVSFFVISVKAEKENRIKSERIMLDSMTTEHRYLAPIQQSDNSSTTKQH